MSDDSIGRSFRDYPVSTGVLLALAIIVLSLGFATLGLFMPVFLLVAVAGILLAVLLTVGCVVYGLLFGGELL